jgi:hypothetical protein
MLVCVRILCHAAACRGQARKVAGARRFPCAWRRGRVRSLLRSRAVGGAVLVRRRDEHRGRCACLQANDFSAPVSTGTGRPPRWGARITSQTGPSCTKGVAVRCGETSDQRGSGTYRVHKIKKVRRSLCVSCMCRHMFWTKIERFFSSFFFLLFPSCRRAVGTNRVGTNTYNQRYMIRLSRRHFPSRATQPSSSSCPLFVLLNAVKQPRSRTWTIHLHCPLVATRRPRRPRSPSQTRS